MANKRYKIKFLLTFLIGFFIFIPFHLAYAEGSFEKAFWTMMGWLAYAWVWLSIVVASVCGWFLNVILSLHLTEYIFSSGDVGKAVGEAWGVSRDIVNMFFIIILLIIAFATILRIGEEWQYKRMLPRFVIAVLLVNFSRSICTVLIELSEVLTRSFIGSIVGQGQKLGDRLASILKLDDYLKTVNSGLSNSMVVFTLFLVGLFIFAFAFALVAVAGLFLVRLVVLIILVILSPWPFFLDLVPQLKNYSSKWWSNFVKYLIYGPVAAFFLIASIRILAVMSEMSLPMPKGKISDKLVAESFTKDGGKNLLCMILAVAMMYGSVYAAKALGVAGANAAMGLGKFGAVAAPLAAAKIGKGIVKGRGGAIRSWADRRAGGGKPGRLTTFAKGISKAASLPGIIKERYQKKREELRERAELGRAKMKDEINERLNKIPGFGTRRTDEAVRIAATQQREAAESLALPTNADYLKSQLKNITDENGNVKSGQKGLFDAILARMYGINENEAAIQTLLKKGWSNESEHEFMEKYYGDNPLQAAELQNIALSRGHFGSYGHVKWDDKKEKIVFVSDPKERKELALAKFRELEPQDRARKTHPRTFFKEIKDEKTGKFKLSLSDFGREALGSLTPADAKQAGRYQVRTLRVLASHVDEIMEAAEDFKKAQMDGEDPMGKIKADNIRNFMNAVNEQIGKVIKEEEKKIRASS